MLWFSRKGEKSTKVNEVLYKIDRKARVGFTLWPFPICMSALRKTFLYKASHDGMLLCELLKEQCDFQYSFVCTNMNDR